MDKVESKVADEQAQPVEESNQIDLNYFNGDAQAFAKRFNVPVPGDPLQDQAGGQAETGQKTGHRKTTAGLLNVRLGKRRLVGRRIGHRHAGAIQDADPMATP